MLKFFRSLIPELIRTYFTNYQIKKKYDVIFEKGATAGRQTVFEGKNLLKQNAQVYSCYVGLGTYISGNSKLNRMHIGRFCSIGQNVSNAFGIHPTNWVSTHPVFYSIQKQAGFTFAQEQLFDEHKYVDEEKKYFVKVGNDVWIGNDVKIMDGITIGDGAIVATGSIVTKDVVPYSIVGGIPAKLIRKRFTDQQISFLKDFRWWERDLEWTARNYYIFNNINKFLLFNENKE